MIFLTKGQTLYDNAGMVTYDPTGYYEDGDSVVCAVAAFPDEPVCRYEAKFIAYGNIVYNIADPDALLEEVKKISPDTLFGKTNADKVASDIVETIQMADSQNPTTETVEIPVEEVASSTPAIDIPTDPVIPTDVSTTTQAVSPVDVSTTTPAISIPEEIVPSTPSIEQVIENLSTATTTPEAIVGTDVISDATTTTP